MKKVVLILFGVALLLAGLFLALGVLVYSMKEKDNDVAYGYLISFGFVVSGIYFLVKGIKIKLSTPE